ncbi:MAG: DUF167 domain-containing protein [Alphaproteobacteria bacterium]|nr:DUF167 domain-containing protein [Alphaproteobacteria bacterium]
MPLPPGLARIRADGLTLSVQVTPKARRAGIQGVRGTPPVLRVAVSEAPEDGKATAAVVALVAKALDMPRASVTLLTGQASRAKTLHIAGEPAAIERRLAALLAQHASN